MIPKKHIKKRRNRNRFRKILSDVFLFFSDFLRFSLFGFSFPTEKGWKPQFFHDKIRMYPALFRQEGATHV